jgi:hypothetical protein
MHALSPRWHGYQSPAATRKAAITHLALLIPCASVLACLQRGFLDAVLTPMYQLTAAFAPEASGMLLAHIERNRGLWEQLGQHACHQHAVICAEAGVSAEPPQLPRHGGDGIDKDLAQCVAIEAKCNHSAAPVCVADT